ncbi:MAG: hypothetical protein Q4B28_03770 [bacterium]|nr:hypothetical protein [bacterium]
MWRTKLLEKSSLFDSEFMLLINDDILEIVKIDPFLKEGVSTDDDVDFS